MCTLSLLQQQIDFFPLNYISMALITTPTNIDEAYNATTTTCPVRNDATTLRGSTHSTRTRRRKGPLAYALFLVILRSFTKLQDSHPQNPCAQGLHHGLLFFNPKPPWPPPMPWAPIEETRQAKYDGRRRHPARSSTSTIEECDEALQGSIEIFSHDIEVGSLGHLNDFWLSQGASQLSLSDNAYNTNHDDKNRIATQRQKTSHMARKCPTEKISWSITSVDLEHPNLCGREPHMSLEHAVTRQPGKHSCFWKSMGQCVGGFQFILLQNNLLSSSYLW